MARHANRVRIHSLNGTPLYHVGRVEAERMQHAGEVRHSAGKWFRTENQLQSPLSPVNLTSADMQGVVERRPRAIRRVANWPVEFNRRSLTIIAGRGAWVPDVTPERIEACSKLHQQASHAKRYAATARN